MDDILAQVQDIFEAQIVGDLNLTKPTYANPGSGLQRTVLGRKHLQCLALHNLCNDTIPFGKLIDL